MQLIFGNVELLTPQGLDRISKVVDAIGPYKEFYTVGVENTIHYSPDLKSLRTDNASFDAEISKLGGFIGPDLLSREAKKRGLEQIVFTFYSSYEPSQSVRLLILCD